MPALDGEVSLSCVDIPPFQARRASTVTTSTSRAIATFAIWLFTCGTLSVLVLCSGNAESSSNEKGWIYLGMLVVVAAAASTRFIWKGGSGG